MWLTGPVAPRHVGSSQTGARTRVPCIGRQILNHCATREAPHRLFDCNDGLKKGEQESRDDLNVDRGGGGGRMKGLLGILMCDSRFDMWFLTNTHTDAFAMTDFTMQDSLDSLITDYMLHAFLTSLEQKIIPVLQ